MRKILFSILGIILFSNGYSQITYTPLYDNTALAQKTIDIAKPVGAVAGAAAVSPTGAATYNIPIFCPPGTNGMKPDLSVSYNSQSGNGLLGMGWNISGLSVISRVSKDIQHDGKVAPVTYTYDDRFALDGTRLNAINGSYGGNNSEYSPEMEDFSHIVSYGNVGNGPEWFYVKKKDGTVLEFGNTTDSRFMTDDGANVMLWRLNRITDISGNYIDFVYFNDIPGRRSAIYDIKYTGNTNTGLQPYNKIHFNYDVRSDANKQFDGGASIVSNLLVMSVEISGESGSVIKSYEFSYGTDQITSYLTQFVEKDRNGLSLNSTVFKYGDISPELITTGNVVNNLPSQCHLFAADLDGDGVSEIISSNTITGAGNYDYVTGLSVYKKAPGSNIFNPAATLNISGTNVVTFKKRDYPANAFGFKKNDFNGDGYEDILTIKSTYNPGMNYYDVNSFDIFYGDANTVVNTQPYSVQPTTIWAGSNINVCQTEPQHHEAIFTADFNGDKKSDILAIFDGNLSSSNAHFPFLYEDGITARAIQNIDFAQIGTDDFNVEVIDFDGDGKSELMFMNNQAFYIYAFTKQANNDYTATLVHSGGYPTAWHKVYAADFNGDGKTDFLTCTGDGVLWEKALSTGKSFETNVFSFNHQPTPPQTFSNYDRILMADYNGDGRTDILQIYSGINGAPDNMAVYYSKGATFEYKIFTSPDVAGMLSPADVNGDGKTDVISQLTILDPPNFLYLRKEGKENLLEQIMDGKKSVTVFDYKNITAGAPFYSRGAANTYPLVTIQSPSNLLSSISLPNGIGGQNITYFWLSSN